MSQSELSQAEITELVDKCLAARELSYSPYSKFRVGAAVLDAHSNTVVVGANIENASYGLCICAERTAYVKALTSGVKKFKAVAVATDVVDKPVWPCGACRQFMAEFGIDTMILAVKPDRTFSYMKLSTLIPETFLSSDLEEKRN